MSTGEHAIDGGTYSNFIAINHAVELEAAKRAELVALYQSRLRRNNAERWFYILATVVLIALAVVVCWYLLTKKPSESTIASRDVVSEVPSATAQEDKEGFSSIAQAEAEAGMNPDAAEAPFITTNYTVFDRVVTPSGEPVVTGRVYEPESDTTPVEQYCYVEASGFDGSIQAIRLSATEKSTGELIEYELPEEYAGYREFATQYCRFNEQ